MGKTYSLGVQLIATKGLAEVTSVDLDTVLVNAAKDIIYTLYCLGPHHVYRMDIGAFGQLKDFGLADADWENGRIAFLTEKGTRYAIRSGYQSKKDAWHSKKNEVRRRELNELYAVLGKVPEEDGDEFQGDRG